MAEEKAPEKTQENAPETEHKNKKPLVWAAQFLFGVVLVIFIYQYGLFMYEIVAKEFAGNGITGEQIVSQLLLFMLIIIGTKIFLAVTRFIIKMHLEFTGAKREKKVVLSLYSFFVWMIVIGLVIFTVFKDVGALITSIGLIGFGITFALQGPLLNFVGWLSIGLTKPFTIGDRIEVNNIRGDVIAINKMHTTLQATRTDTHERAERTVTVPNSLILTTHFMNYSKTNNYYVDEVIVSITYESNWRKAIELLKRSAENAVKQYVKKSTSSKTRRRSLGEAVRLLREASKKLGAGEKSGSLEENIKIMSEAETIAEEEPPEPRVQMTAGASSLDLSVLYHTDMYSVRDTKHAVLKNFLEEIEKQSDIEMAYPHMEIVYKDKNNSPNAEAEKRKSKGKK